MDAASLDIIAKIVFVRNTDFLSEIQCPKLNGPEFFILIGATKSFFSVSFKMAIETPVIIQLHSFRLKKINISISWRL